MKDRAEVDRNLLVGLLAAKVELISPEELLAGLTAWARDDSRPLCDWLVELGALSEGRRELIESLAVEYLRRHDGDPALGLEALSGVEAFSASIRGLGHEELSASIARVGTTSGRRAEAAEDSFATRVPDGNARESSDPNETRVGAEGGGFATRAGLGGRLGNRFRVVRMHAKGGLGVVSIAIDRELDRAVALKEIQDRHADEPSSRSRFLIEAEITGKLEHPGIIPVYGLGTYADGRPYYAMRFVRGDSLREAIAAHHDWERRDEDAGARRVRLNELLGRFVDLCQAIAYAHSRGVLHRDIKPGNVMLGPYGETLVVDWGLAKAVEGPEPVGPSASAVDPDAADPTAFLAGAETGSERVRISLSGSRAEETRPGQAVGTPAYMSPEQAEGRASELGAPSDIYSLGATLYCLLTGRAPFDGNVLSEMLARVARGEFPPPRKYDPSLSKPLEAICLKAMALRPADRYDDAQALALDVERWRADEPVSAWPEPWFVRAGRWVRRHKTLVASTAVGLIAVGLGLGAFAAQGAVQRAVEEERAEVLVKAIAEAEEAQIDRVPALVREVRAYPPWIDAKLRALRRRSEPGSAARRNATLALLPRDPGLGPEAAELVLSEKALPEDIAVLGPALADLGPGLSDALWDAIAEPPDPETFGRWLRAASTLRADPDSASDPLWRDVARSLADRLEAGADSEGRREALLALGSLPDAASTAPRDRLRDPLLSAFRGDPDPGVHSALGWLLRERWGLGAEAAAVEANLAGAPPTAGRHWFLDGTGRTYAIFPTVVEFQMGTPTDRLPEAIRAEAEQYEPPHRRAIPRRFAMATTEVTAAEFREFLADHPDTGHYRFDQETYGPGEDAPAISVSWHEAAQFCRWLDEREGIAPDQMCYPPVDRIKPGFEADLPADFLERTGYRLPTEAEWEYAARGGTATLRPFGEGTALLGEFAWWGGNSPDDANGLPYPHARRVGSKLPNRAGLFDVLGNAMEWCHDSYRPYPETTPDRPPFSDGSDGNPGADDRMRIVRGHSFAMPNADYLRSGQRDLLDRLTVNSTVGFRLARTLPEPLVEPAVRIDDSTPPPAPNNPENR